MNSGIEMREGSKVKISELVDMEDVCGRVPGLDLLCKEPLFGKSSAFTGLCHSGDAFIHYDSVRKSPFTHVFKNALDPVQMTQKRLCYDAFSVTSVVRLLHFLRAYWSSVAFM